MDRKDLRRRLAKRPNAVRFDELRRYLELCGWRLDRIRGSHHIFVKDGNQLPVPLRRPHVLATYVRQALTATHEETDDA